VISFTGLQKRWLHLLPNWCSYSLRGLPWLIVGCVGWFFESVVGRILNSGYRFKMVVGFKFYLSGCTSYRCLQQVIRQLIIKVKILHHEDQDHGPHHYIYHVPSPIFSKFLGGQNFSPKGCRNLDSRHQCRRHRRCPCPRSRSSSSAPWSSVGVLLTLRRSSPARAAATVVLRC
jgi:hypothetical protein